MSAKSTDEPARSSTRPDHPYQDGVDVTLIRWMLTLTPTQRLQVLQDFVNDAYLAQKNLTKR
ncbi:MAG TPA: hypothetical protein VLU25_11990 [Acidobacteriota bacterium]|nr:hypothetical protein [Acidobacteriota bacterium]